MDPTAAPWRILEAGPEPTGNRKADKTSAQPAIGGSVLLVGAAAIGLAVLAFFLAFGSAGGGGVLVEGTTALDDPAASAMPVGVAISREPELIVQIVGAVARPGVFHLPGGARVGDLVEAAGGYSARVDAARASRELNLAARLNDGDQVRVPSRDDEEPSGPVTGDVSEAATDGLVDLNRATAAELEALPGIGPVTANKILGARDELPFSSVDELRSRKLVGEKTFTKLKDLVTVR